MKTDPPVGWLPGLDGLRALAIGVVVWMHLEVYGWIHTGISVAWGRQGVCLFFVLSGYLITRNLLARPQLGRFYRRRARRILPPLYAYLTVVAGLWAAGVYSLAPAAFLASATCWANFYRLDLGLPLEHTWSLSLEEQYYLVWPLALRWLGAGRCARLLPLVILAWPVQRWLRSGSLGHPTAEIAFFSATYDLLLWGSLGALLHRGRQLKGAGIPWLAMVALVGLPWWPAVLIPPVRGLAWTVLILWIVDQPRSALTRVLELPALRWLGTRSYSLYLWHLLFCDARLQPWFAWPVALLLSLLCAELSYRHFR